MWTYCMKNAFMKGVATAALLSMIASGCGSGGDPSPGEVVPPPANEPDETEATSTTVSEGADTPGRTEDPTASDDSGDENVVVRTRYVSAGREHSCALHTDDTLICWGNDSKGQTDAPSGVFHCGVSRLGAFLRTSRR